MLSEQSQFQRSPSCVVLSKCHVRNRETYRHRNDWLPRVVAEEQDYCEGFFFLRSLRMFWNWLWLWLHNYAKYLKGHWLNCMIFKGNYLETKYISTLPLKEFSSSGVKGFHRLFHGCTAQTYPLSSERLHCFPDAEGVVCMWIFLWESLTLLKKLFFKDISHLNKGPLLMKTYEESKQSSDFSASIQGIYVQSFQLQSY